MNYCIYCGDPYEPGERFCGSCGQATEVGYEEEYESSSLWQNEYEDQYEPTSYLQGGHQEEYRSSPYQQDGFEGEAYSSSYGNYGQVGGAHQPSLHEEPKKGGNTVLIAIASVLTIALLAFAGYFFVVPLLVDDEPTSGDFFVGEDGALLTSEERVGMVIDAIDEINPVLLTHEDTSVQEARELFEALSPQEQEQVTNIDELEEFEEMVQLLIAEHEGVPEESEVGIEPEEERDTETPVADQVFDMDELNRVISARTEPRNVAVAVLDLNTGAIHHTENGNSQFVAAGFYAPVYAVVREYYGNNTGLIHRANDMMGRSVNQIAQMNDDANHIIRSIGDLAGINRRLGSMGFTATHFGRFFGTTGGQNYTSATEAVQILERVYQTGGYRRMSFNLGADGVSLPSNASFNAHRGSGIGDAYNVFAVVEAQTGNYAVVILTDHMGQDRAIPVVSDVLREVHRQMGLIHE